MERGETLARAVERELLEETGLAVRCGNLMGWVERISDTHHFVILDFDVEVLSDADPVAGGDASQASWVPLSAVRDANTVTGLVGFLEDHGVLG